MDIKETTFGPKKYLTLKKSISTDQITDKAMYDEVGKKLGEYMGKNEINPAGPWSVLYFTWDEVNKKTDIGIAFPVEGVESANDPELSIVDLPESKASMAVLKGDYSGLALTHQTLMDYSRTQNFTGEALPVIAVEEYLVAPLHESNPANYITNIYYLHN